MSTKWVTWILALLVIAVGIAVVLAIQGKIPIFQGYADDAECIAEGGSCQSNQDNCNNPIPEVSCGEGEVCCDNSDG